MSQGIGVVNGVTMSCAVKCRTRAFPKGGKGKTVKVVQKNIGFGDKKLKEPLWQCVQHCGACCKLEKGPSFATPEEIFDNPDDIQTSVKASSYVNSMSYPPSFRDIDLYKSLVGADGWCINYDKNNRRCSIYDERPYFCRVEQDVFQSLYGISKKKFNKEACSFCNDTIKSIYGADSEELDRFNKAVRS